ncbi:PorP/SprF family type IX secretion system membrane protein [Carboxylicivirga sp. N1Y90]|uniref:PorP/SprF family type IX secretion system membrane protein n=1 Tax=Carboxylicivirga fragile TaxID=3417571 RepID=UPI003D339BEF|nr:type IX secretion system membrane protein PorP/SprF [Marinilabiliaceae bacterium N1Y90]
MNKFVSIVLFVLVGGVSAVAQKDLVMSQYMHNRYSVNSAFAGNREALSLNGTFRKKWMGINGSPSAQYFSVHSPLRNEKIALGLDVYNQQYGVTRQTGFSLSYTYRLKLDNDQILSFGLSGGMSFNASNWTDITTLDEFVEDPEFQNNENVSSPLVGFGAAWYGKNFFAGVSAPNLFKYDISEGGSSEFAPGDVNYIVTGGYLFELSKQFDLQPTVLTRFNPAETTHVDLNATLIYSEMIWLGVSYRTTSDVVALLGYQVTPQLRFSYSFDYSLGEISAYNNGTHEIGIQFDFGYKIKTPNPKFF